MSLHHNHTESVCDLHLYNFSLLTVFIQQQTQAEHSYVYIIEALILNFKTWFDILNDDRYYLKKFTHCYESYS